jgi:hypothetical protein
MLSRMTGAGAPSRPWWSTSGGTARRQRLDVGVISGDVRLPPGFDHPHASEAARRIAERGTILRVQVGSGAFVYGTVEADSGDLHDVIARVDARRVPMKGDRVWLKVRTGDEHLFDAESGERLNVTA